MRVLSVFEDGSVELLSPVEGVKVIVHNYPENVYRRVKLYRRAQNLSWYIIMCNVFGLFLVYLNLLFCNFVFR